MLRLESWGGTSWGQFQSREFFNHVLNEQLLAPFPPPTPQYFHVPHHSHMIYMDAPREVMASMKPRWFRLVSWELMKALGSQLMTSILKGEIPLKWILKGLSGSPRNTFCATPWWLATTDYNKRNMCFKDMFERWGGLLNSNLNLKWENVLDIIRSKKEGVFILSLWHKVVSLYSWHARFVPNVDDKWHMGLWHPQNHST